MSVRGIAICMANLVALVACGSGVESGAPDAGVHESAPAASKGEIRVVGSSTVYPFSTKVAQEFKNKTGHNVVVESTGSGGGHKLFCAGTGEGTPDVTNSSRRQKSSELEKCKSNGVGEVVEIKIGFDGIVLANAIDGAAIDMSLREIYLAFAKQVPIGDDDCALQDNPYTKWSDINSNLPDAVIEAYGPPPTSGTRDAFVEIAMEGGAKQVTCLSELRGEDEDAFKTIAHTLREDGKWIDAGENDNAIVQTLTNTPTAIGVFGYSFLDQNADIVKGARIASALPTFENISSGDYPVSRSLFFYMKASHARQSEGLKDFALEFTSEEAWAPGGYLEEIGLVPLSDDERVAYRAAVENLIAYEQ